ncbi:MAG: tetratricopeptide repeat protein [Kordiimonadaceae bacterium]|nr:tetratricopeptide repeat protein [Kordiimonadaceae bacterium]MBT6033811.1 tetratricopeptide repeat protein [Kordiimonadaceae bacterium]
MRNSIIVFVSCLTLSLSSCGDNNQTETVTSTDLGPDFDLLTTSVGTVHFPVGCNAEAAPLVERGVALIHHMMYEEAEFVFSMADDADPNCAMAYWGQAMTIMHPLWPDVPTNEKLAKGQALVAKTMELGGHSERENAYLETTRTYFDGEISQPESERLKRFAAEWEKLNDAYPDDLDARAFHALTLLSTADRGDLNLVKQRAAGALAFSVLDENPDHPGGHHYIIHSYDDPKLAEMARTTADKYGQLTPRVPHATHMMTHTYTRLGDWEKSIEWNMVSSETALALCIERGEVNNHYTHALDYLAYAHLQKGNDAAAIQVLKDYSVLEAPYSDLNRSSFAYAFSALPARIALEQRDWETATKLQPKIPRDFPWEKGHDQYVAITHFTRAVALSHLGRFDEADAEIETLYNLRMGMGDSSPYWSKQVEIQEVSARAWQIYARGNIEEGLDLMKQATILEASTEKHAVTPGEVLPATEMYGDMLLENGSYAEALAAYQAALTRAPGKYNSLYGAGKAAMALGDNAMAKEYFEVLLQNAENVSGSRTTTNDVRMLMASF